MMNTRFEDKTAQKKLHGIAINSGRVVGRVCMYSAERHHSIPEYSLLTDEAITVELERFDDVLADCSRELNGIASEVADTIGKPEAEIFLTQKHIMNDRKVTDAVRKIVTANRRNVEWAISEVLGEFEDRFARLDNEYLRERATDIGEIRRRLLAKLGHRKAGFVCHGLQHCSKGHDRIIIAEELTPDMFVSMDIEKVLAFVTERGGFTSHAAIMARSLGIPAVTGVSDIMNMVSCGDRLLVDGDSGNVYLYPSESTVEELIPVDRVESESVCILDSPPGMQIMANASTLEDVRTALRVGADGVGLLRTEIFFIKADRLLDEQEQAVIYSDVSGIMDRRPVTFRMLDVGGDKPLPFLRIRKEANPFLGWRGSRFLLGNPAIFETQLRALGRLTSREPVRILFPMVVDAAQYRMLVGRAREVLSAAGSDPGKVLFGAMFEIPSAFMQAREILAQADFASIGSNDLVQYLFAIDRGNELVSQEYDPEHPVLWEMLGSLSAAARELGKPLTICGELASHHGLAARFLDIGITTLSVAPRLIPRVRNELARRP